MSVEHRTILVCVRTEAILFPIYIDPFKLVPTHILVAATAILITVLVLTCEHIAT